jgi:hypothetical protein
LPFENYKFATSSLLENRNSGNSLLFFERSICLFLFCFITRSGRPALASVPDTINCSRLITEYVHVYIISSRCDTTPGQQLQSAFFLEWGYHSRRSPIQVLTVPMLLHFCARNRGNRCFNIVRPLALEFSLLRMVRQPSADAHVI